MPHPYTRALLASQVSLFFPEYIWWRIINSESNYCIFHKNSVKDIFSFISQYIVYEYLYFCIVYIFI